jgi:hypothetical protein
MSKQNLPTHSDIGLLRLRLSLSPGQRLQAMLDARALLVGIIRGRLRKKYPDLSEAELNMKVLEEIDRAPYCGKVFWRLGSASFRQAQCRLRRNPFPLFTSTF